MTDKKIKLVFVKSKQYVNSVEELNSEGMLLPDEDTPNLKGVSGAVVMPLAVTSFPKVLSSMTASKAGEYAMAVCRREKWDIDRDNLEACLAQLEMEM